MTDSILIADDEAVNRLFIKQALSQNGWQVQEAADGQEAVRLAGETRFRVIILDVNMPGVDGLEAARQIRRGEAGMAEEERSMIVALSAYNDAEYIQRCKDAGMEGFIKKPVTKRSLLIKLENYLLR